MNKPYLSELADSLSATLRGTDVVLGPLSIDTRTLKPGDCFLALAGPNFDGHDFVVKAEQRGASALIVHQPVESNLPQLLVAKTTQALNGLAKWHRNRFTGPTIGLTGSCGKTTVKSLIAAILSTQSEVLSTIGTQNNEIGVPLTLTRLQPEHEYAVIEMGANNFGEIQRLTQLVCPDIALITNAYAVHLDGFGSVAGVGRGKGEIFQGLPANGVAVIPLNNDQSPYWQTLLTAHRVVTFGQDTAATVFATGIKSQAAHSEFTLHAPQGKVDIDLPLAGLHNVDNALAAAAVCLELGCSLEQIKQGLQHFTPVAGRLVQRQGRCGETIIDDSYNANPTAVNSAIDVLQNYSGDEKWLVLGDMAELGQEVELFHKQVGVNAKLKGINRLFTFGESARHSAFAFGEGALHFESRPALIDYLRQHLHQGVTVLVKGSRAAQLDKVVEALLLPAEETNTC